MYTFFILVFFIHELLLNNIFDVFRLIEKEKKFIMIVLEHGMSERENLRHTGQNETFKLEFYRFECLF